MNPKQPIRFAFNSHGLGDVVHCCHAMKLYQAHGYDVAVQVEANKRWAWEAAGIPIHHGGGLPVHPYYYPDMNKFWDLSTPDHLYSKIAHLFEVSELPKLGTKEYVWNAICDTEIDATHAVSTRAMDDAAKFLEGLPKPIILLHSKGTNWQVEKSIPDGTAFQLILDLLGTGGSVVTLDWDGRAPTLGHSCVRSIKPNWHHISLEEFGALCILSDLFIGVDSGPFHLAGWFDIPTLYVSRKIPPVRCCLPSPRATYLVPARDHGHWAARDERWQFVEYDGDEASAMDISCVASAILNGGEDNVTVTAKDLVPIDDRPLPAIVATSSRLVPDIPGRYTYRRIGYDERPMELLPDGKIGEGAGGCELVWKIERTPVGSVLTIYGHHGGPTCHLTRMQDGVYRGKWLAHERMPIELVPVHRDMFQCFDATVSHQSPTAAPADLSREVSGHPSDALPDAEPNFYFGLLTYNRFDLLDLAIEAALTSTALPKKIYVVDNSGGKWPGHPSCRVEIIRPPYNLGCARGFNVLQFLTQPMPLIVGADDIEVGRDLFERMLANPEGIVFADESRPYSVHLIRSTAWDKIGPWDGKFYPAYHEDNDYTMRAKLACVQTGCPVSSGFIDHGPSATKAAMNSEEIADLNVWFDKNRARYIRKWGGVPHLETFVLPFNGVPQQC